MNREEDLATGLRKGMRCLASGVSVISSVNAKGERAAMTVSSVTSVSNDPPSLLVCINKNARMESIFAESGYFCVNVLGANQQALSEICATPEAGEERFTVGQWAKHEETGIDFVQDAPAVFMCRKEKVVEYGTHNIYFGNIIEVRIGEEKQNALVYVDGKYHYL